MTPQARILLIAAIAFGGIALLSRVAFALLQVEAPVALSEAMSAMTTFVVGLIFRSPMSYRTGGVGPDDPTVRLRVDSIEPPASESNEQLR